MSSGSDDLHAGLVVALEELEQLAGDAPLEAPLDVAAGRGLGGAAGGVGAGLGIVAEPGERDGVQGGVGLAVPGLVQPVAGDLSRRGGDRVGPASAANAAAERSRPAYDQLTRIWAA